MNGSSVGAYRRIRERLVVAEDLVDGGPVVRREVESFGVRSPRVDDAEVLWDRALMHRARRAELVVARVRIVDEPGTHGQVARAVGLVDADTRGCRSAGVGHRGISREVR